MKENPEDQLLLIRSRRRILRNVLATTTEMIEELNKEENLLLKLERGTAHDGVQRV